MFGAQPSVQLSQNNNFMKDSNSNNNGPNQFSQLMASTMSVNASSPPLKNISELPKYPSRQQSKQPQIGVFQSSQFGNANMSTSIQAQQPAGVGTLALPQIQQMSQSQQVPSSAAEVFKKNIEMKAAAAAASAENAKMRKSAQSASSQSLHKKKVFSLSTNNFLRNNAFVTSITKHLQPKASDDEKYRPQIDVKYQLGEVHRCYRVAQYKYVNSVASDSPQILFADNDLLQQKMKNFKQLHAKRNADEDDEDFQDNEDSDNDKTEVGTIRNNNSAIGQKHHAAAVPGATAVGSGKKLGKDQQHNEDSQSMGQSVGFSSFMSKGKSGSISKH